MGNSTPAVHSGFCPAADLEAMEGYQIYGYEVWAVEVEQWAFGCPESHLTCGQWPKTLAGV